MGKKGLSQQDLGNAIGVTKVSVCGYESGTRIPNLEKLAKLADTLDVLESDPLYDETEYESHVIYKFKVA